MTRYFPECQVSSVWYEFDEKDSLEEAKKIADDYMRADSYVSFNRVTDMQGIAENDGVNTYIHYWRSRKGEWKSEKIRELTP